MAIRLARDGEPIEPNHVYLLPPGKELEVRGGKLVPSAQAPRIFSQPIDVLFRSLAEDAGRRAVVLSGSGSDLYQDLLIGVTRFFRDPDAFAFVEQGCSTCPASRAASSSSGRSRYASTTP